MSHPLLCSRLMGTTGVESRVVLNPACGFAIGICDKRGATGLSEQGCPYVLVSPGPVTAIRHMKQSATLKHNKQLGAIR